MQTLLMIAGGALGILVPFLFTRAMTVGIERSAWHATTKARYKVIVVTTVTLWTVLTWAASLGGLIAYHPGDAFPRFLIPLVVPVAAGLTLLLNRTFRQILDQTPLSTLVGVQTFRLAGVAFLLIAALGILPAAFSRAGFGDLATGTLALFAALALARKRPSGKPLFWAFTVAGLFDLSNVAYLLLAHYPLYSDAPLSSAAAFDFSIVLIPALAAPMALLLHVYAARNYLTSKTPARRVQAGDRIEPLELTNIRQENVAIPSQELVHLQFRRYAGFLTCNLHLREFSVRQAELKQHGVREVVVFSSSVDAMLPYQGDLPFDAVADPDRDLYRRFGVETSCQSIADPRAWPAGLRGLLLGYGSVLDGEHGRLGLPADILITADGRVAACHYGRHADDQWTVDEVLGLARASRPAHAGFGTAVPAKSHRADADTRSPLWGR